MTKHLHSALVIDDEPDIRELLQLTLQQMDIEVTQAADVSSAKALLENHHYDLCLTDMRLPDGDGIEIVKLTQKFYPDMPIAVLTAHGSVESAINALKAGAFDFVSKPLKLAQLRELVQTALRLSARSEKNVGIAEPSLIGEHPSMTALQSKINKVAKSQAPVFVTGESGTGKEIVARLIHARSPRNSGPFVPVNCGAIPGDLMESELFGHKKGSFTGAVSDKVGLFQAANGGTLFLDEVADLPISMQVKLLRTIQEKTIRPVGSNSEINIDIRIVSASHKELATEVEAGSFRSDLFYRINVIQLDVPSLRQRSSDILSLTRHILHRLADSWSITTPVVEESAQQALSRYHFPGNVRELENILERAVTLCDSNTITEPDLQLSGASDSNQFSVIDLADINGSLEAYLGELEHRLITQALEKTSGNKTEAAALLGLSFRQMRYKLQKMGLDEPS
ncbi:MAG: sigma-54 dependent transcriptional regulator [Pseudomonadales bacterium]